MNGRHTAERSALNRMITALLMLLLAAAAVSAQGAPADLSIRRITPVGDDRQLGLF